MPTPAVFSDLCEGLLWPELGGAPLLELTLRESS